MLPKSKRLSTKSFAHVMGKGSPTHSTFFIIKSTKTEEPSRFSVSVPKKVAKTAVQRNKIKRQTYSTLKKMEASIKDGYNVTIIAKNGLEKLPFEEMSSEIKKSFVKSGLLK